MTATAPPAATYDAVVIGAGLAGLSAAVRAAEAGARVLVLAKGIGSTHLAPGTIDVLGYAPERVDAPGAALPAFVRDHPDHPYGRLAVDDIRRAVDWFKARFDAGVLSGYRYRGSLDHNVLLPTALGVPKPSAVVPETMIAGDLRAGGQVCVVGLRWLKDLSASYLADNLGRAGLGIEARAVELDLRPERRADANALAFARALDDAGFRATLAGALQARLDAGERVGMPAVLGLDDPHAVWEDLERRLERPVFEIPALPPSVPGIRVYRALKEALRRAGGRIVLNAVVAGAERANGRVTALRARVAARERTYLARWVVLASGGMGSGGVAVDSRWNVRETILGLPLANVPAAGEARFAPGYFDPQPLARVGVATDASLRPVDADGRRAAENVLVVGASLAGAEPWREKSGDGVSLATGHRAGELIEEEAR
jgi:glycerol-3-phosphate dehydrogenase subunit B